MVLAELVVETVSELVVEVSEFVGVNPGYHAMSLPAFTGRLAYGVNVAAPVNTAVELAVLQLHSLLPAFKVGWIGSSHGAHCS